MVATISIHSIQGYWETFIWEEGTGLIYYQSGYRDGVDYMMLKGRA
ncbi:MAG: hypothetical protein ACLTJ5_06720 [Clostridium sp.]